MKDQGEDREALRRSTNEIMTLLKSMLDIAKGLNSINYLLDSWRGKAKEDFFDKYQMITSELLESLEYCLSETATIKQKID